MWIEVFDWQPWSFDLIRIKEMIGGFEVYGPLADRLLFFIFMCLKTVRLHHPLPTMFGRCQHGGLDWLGWPGHRLG